jgi:hypothetical protein
VLAYLLPRPKRSNSRKNAAAQVLRAIGISNSKSVLREKIKARGRTARTANRARISPMTFRIVVAAIIIFVLVYLFLA